MKDEYELKKIKTLETIGLHRQRVFQIMSRLSHEMILRGNKHDESKFESEELPYYINTIDIFEKNHFDSEGYYKAKESLGPALEHHYKHNRHHPEHFNNGIEGMNLVDILELLADWKSATLNRPNHRGDILESVDILSKKYGICDQLKTLLINTLKDFDMVDN